MKGWRFILRNSMWLGFLLIASPVQAFEINPFYAQNQSPLVRIFGLPSIGNATLLPPKKTDVRLIVDLANNFVDDQNQKENVLLDGESIRTSLDARYGISRDFELGIVIPYLVEGGGFLDGFIDWYHHALGFPGGGRDYAPQYRLLYRYQKDGRKRLRMDHSGAGLGDISMDGAWQVYGGEGRPSSVALRASLKLPTGDSNRLRGSGSTDFALWAVASHAHKTAYGPFTLFGGAGMMGMTDGEVLRDQQRNLVGFGVLGVGWSPARWVALKVQGNGHTAFYKDSQLEELNAVAVQLTAGATFAFSPNTTLDFGITEDVIIRTSPDVVFHTALRHRF